MTPTNDQSHVLPRRRRRRRPAVVVGVVSLLLGSIVVGRAEEPVRTVADNAADDGSASGRLLARLDLRSPALVGVAKAVEADDTAAALRAWRAAVVAKLRRSELGTFEHHEHNLRDRKPLADLLVGRLDRSDYAKAVGPSWFRDLYGMSGPPGESPPIDWLAVAEDPVVETTSAYGTFSFAIPLVAQYWQTEDPIYLRKWLAIVGDFATRQRPRMERLPEASRPRGNSPWIVAGDTCLLQSQKVVTIIRCLAVLAKSLPDGGEAKPRDWSRALAPVATPATAAGLDLLDVESLAAIVLSLTGDDPPALFEMYEQTRAPPNQRCQGLAALLMIASQFPDVQGMSNVRERAGAAMHEHVLASFHKDGGMLEQSLNYNVDDAARLRQLGRMLRDDPPAWLPDLASRLAMYDRLIVSLRTPAGELPIIGNNTSNPPPLWRGEDVRTRWSSGTGQGRPRVDASRLDFTSIAFPYSGYYVQRGSWDWASGYLFFMNARPAAGHFTMDNLCVELHAYGRPLLVRGGPPHYALHFLPAEHRGSAEAVERYFGETSSYKLNTVVVDGFSQVRVGNPATVPHELPITARWHTSKTFDYVEGIYELGYGERSKPATHVRGVTHHRQVVFVRPLTCWLVVDSMRSTSKVPHAYTQIWKVPPWLEAPEGGGESVSGFTEEQVVSDRAGFHTSDPAGPNLWLHQSRNVKLTTEFHRGERDPYLGWYARQLGDLVPATDVHVRFGGSGDVVVTTLLWPTPGADAPFTPAGRAEVGGAAVLSQLEAWHHDGARVASAASAREPAALTAGSVAARATLLVVLTEGASVRGIALGCTSLEAGGEKQQLPGRDVEFQMESGRFRVLSAIGRPKDFTWVNGPRGARPTYGE